MSELKFVSPQSFDTLKDIWQKLETGADMTAFQSYEWYSRLNEQFLKGCFPNSDSVFYAVLYDNGEAKLIYPLYIKKYGFFFRGIGVSRGIYIFGEWSHADYLNLIYKDFSSDAFEKILKAVAEKFKGKDIFLSQIHENTQINAYLLKKYPSCVVNRGTCLEIEKSVDFETYHKSLKKNVRQNIRTAFNRVNKDGMQFSVDELANADVDTAKELFELYAGRSRAKNSFKGGSFKKRFFTEYYARQNKKLFSRQDKYNYLTQTMIHGKRNCILVFKLDGVISGFAFGMRAGDKISFPVVVLNEDYGKYSPCIIGLYSFIERMYAENRFMTIDLTRGNEKYKYDLGATETINYYYRIPCAGVDL